VIEVFIAALTRRELTLERDDLSGLIDIFHMELRDAVLRVIEQKLAFFKARIRLLVGEVAEHCSLRFRLG